MLQVKNEIKKMFQVLPGGTCTGEPWGLSFFTTPVVTQRPIVAGGGGFGGVEINFHFVPGDWRGVSGTGRPWDIGVVSVLINTKMRQS